eukprot:COSAG02_NODE_3320_length_6947_cov_4.871349_5_plen_179_part_00
MLLRRLQTVRRRRLPRAAWNQSQKPSPTQWSSLPWLCLIFLRRKQTILGTYALSSKTGSVCLDIAPHQTHKLFSSSGLGAVCLTDSLSDAPYHFAIVCAIGSTRVTSSLSCARTTTGGKARFKTAMGKMTTFLRLDVRIEASFLGNGLSLSLLRVLNEPARRSVGMFPANLVELMKAV